MLFVWGIVKDQSQEAWACCRCVVLYKDRSEPGGLGMLLVCGIVKDGSEPGGLGMLQVWGAACLMEA